VVETESVTGVVAAIGASPVVGFLGGGLLILAIYWLFRRSNRGRVMPWFTNLQRASAAYMAFSHGRNDAQKPMGILALAIALYYNQELTVPIWIVVSAATVAAVGTAYGGWRIMRTLGMRLTELDPVQGFAAEFAGASVLEAASVLGIPVSTTHTITSSILGVGASRRLSAVRWGVTAQIFLSWVLTLPATILAGALYVKVLGSVL
jgi:inorganic phosphate transporter, PiT family